MTNSLLWKLRTDGLIYSRKRKETTRSFIASIVSIFLALIVALLIATAMGYNPFIIISRLFTIGFEDPTYLFYKIGVYAVAGFAFYFAWKCGIINIGISGQMLLSGTIIVLLTQAIGDDIPNGAGQVFIIVIGIIVGSITSTFIGALQIYLRVNSIVASILLNWIIYFICFFILATYTVSPGVQFVSSGEIGLNYCLIDQSTNTGGIIPIIVIVIVLAIIMFIIFKYTVFGHKIKSIGLSKDASLYAGYNVKMLSLSSYAISGAISGILACICYTASTTHSIPLSTFYDAIPTEGFDGIMISLVGNNNPIGIVLASSLFGLFGSSAQGLPTDPSFNNVIVGCVLLGSAMSVILFKLKPWIKIKTLKYDINYSETQTSFDNSIDSLLSKFHSINSTTNSLLKNIKKTKNIDEINKLINENNFNINLELDLNKKIKLYKKMYRNYLKKKYINDKNQLIDKFKYEKLLDLIYSRLLTSDIIKKKINIINNKYDNKLTKYINKLKHKEETIKNNETRINKIKTKMRKAIDKNTKWKTRAINRMEKYQNRFIVSSKKANDQINIINNKLIKINNDEYKLEINNILSNNLTSYSLNSNMKGGE